MKLYNLMQQKYLNSITEEGYKLLVQAAARSHEWAIAQYYQMSMRKCSTGNNKSPFQFEVEHIQT